MNGVKGKLAEKRADIKKNIPGIDDGLYAKSDSLIDRLIQCYNNSYFDSLERKRSRFLSSSSEMDMNIAKASCFSALVGILCRPYNLGWETGGEFTGGEFYELSSADDISKQYVLDRLKESLDLYSRHADNFDVVSGSDSVFDFWRQAISLYEDICASKPLAQEAVTFAARAYAEGPGIELTSLSSGAVVTTPAGR